MPHRDPETGQFRSLDFSEFDSVEQIHRIETLSVPAADVGGQTGQQLGQFGNFESVEFMDYGDILDRTQLGVIVWAYHKIEVYIASTQTADGTIRGSIELSFDPSQDVARGVNFSQGDIDDASGDFTVEVNGYDPIGATDLLGPPLVAVGFGPITDGTNGVGGSGTAGTDEWEGSPMVRPVVDAADELFMNGVIEHSNVSDASLHMDVQAWHIVGRID